MIEIRELKSSDIFPMVAILNKVGFRELKTILTPEKIKEMMKAVKGSGEEEVDSSTVLGFNLIFEVVGIIMNNLPSCEQEIYRFLSGVTGLSSEEVANLSMSDFAETIVAVVQKPEFMDFFKAVSKLFK